MKGIRGWIALALLQAALAPAAAAAVPDAAGMWEQFLATGNYHKSMSAYAVLTSTGYNGTDVDATSCKDHAADVRSAVETVPVSIAIHRVAYLCADATGDTAMADREMEVLAALSRHALKQAGDPQVARPIAVIAPADA
jgi:hypothetical protein